MNQLDGKATLAQAIQMLSALRGHIEKLEAENAQLKAVTTPLQRAQAAVKTTPTAPRPAQQAAAQPQVKATPRPTVIPTQQAPQQGVQAGTVKPIAPAAIIDSDVAHPPTLEQK